ncbi:hypothetical protein E3P92_02914 [Wallemia ichthyophaga]|uniref:Uncharacterized protein n=2 Tax=Wallemia ichthyophaga TaxID=245174 RepID=A0A4V4LT59_WALIC|nr:DNA-directed RNA polymerase III subunit rpc8 [Wallemia ichthyophaga EXF-994]TIA80285.1 hypothetical protein E3P98_02764 [Wallemia ichthyophaga]EOR00222.1 DNA-directed RNA polymerase III subunit rpc8 [Wallemia ichthyophaga EXF-994]TIA89083.1 hypothetical protein E3P97_03258 [Wallemia ichthyophaga]TIA97782.1 hypothetical protein E3P95_02690 [Wallemia ichthyophaga]TIA98954.1 hypothetical protein E3P94_02741 [Wallemia ichthyophaga]
MFILSLVKDTIPVIPSNLNLEPSIAIRDSINSKYSNKILQDVGLSISLHSIIQSSQGYLQHSNGNVYYKVTFNLLVFRPFIGEILLAKVKSTNQHGIIASIDFFDDIWIPKNQLPEISEFDSAENTFFWLAGWEDGDPFTSSPEQRAYIDIGEQIRIRVEAEHFENVYPTPKKKQLDDQEEAVPTAYRLTASIDGQGLGIVSWWEQDDEDEQDDSAMDQ